MTESDITSSQTSQKPSDAHNGSLKALFVWAGGILPDRYRDRISDAVQCVRKEGKNGQKGGSVYVAWHSGKNDIEHAKEWKRMQELGKEIGFSPIDLAPAVNGSTDEIPELGITVNEAYRSHLKKAVTMGPYSEVSELIKLGTLACKKESESVCLLDVDFRLNKDVSLIDFLDEKPRIRYNYVQPKERFMLWYGKHPSISDEYKKEHDEIRHLSDTFDCVPIDIAPLIRGEISNVS